MNRNGSKTERWFATQHWRIRPSAEKRGAIMKRHTISTGGVIGAIVIICMFCLAPPAFAAYEDSLLQYYQFGNSLKDSTGNVADGTAVGDPTFGAGKFGQAVRLNGLGDYISLAGDPFDGASAITVSAWVSSTTLDYSTYGYGAIYTNGQGPGQPNFEVAIVRDEEGDHDHRFFLGHEDSGGLTSASINAATWYMVTAVLGNSENKLYVDGTLVASNDFYGNNLQQFAGGDYRIGSINTWHQYFDGLIDDVGVWNRALDANEIEAICLVGINRFQAIIGGLTDLGISYTTAEVLAMAELSAGLEETATVNGVTWYRSKGTEAEWRNYDWALGDNYYDSETGYYYLFDAMEDTKPGGSDPYQKPPGANDGELDESDKDGGVPEPSATAVGGIAIALIGLLKRMRKRGPSL